MASWSRLRHRSLKSRNSATSAPMGDCSLAAALYIDDMRASMSAKWAPRAGSPIAMRCAFVGHLRNAENNAAVIGVFASIAVDCARVSTDTIRKQCHDRIPARRGGVAIEVARQKAWHLTWAEYISKFDCQSHS